MKKFIAWAFLVLIIAVFACMLSGCSQKWYDNRDIGRQHEYNNKFPSELAKDCAKQFPVKDSIGKVKPSVNVDYSKTIDSLQWSFDSLKNITFTGTGGIHFDTTSHTNNPANNSTNALTIINSLQAKIKALKQAYKPCKPDTIPVYREDQAKTKVWQDIAKAKGDSLLLAKGRIDQLNKDKAGLIKWIWILGGILAAELIGFIIYILYKVYTGGAASAAGSVIEKL